MNHYHSDSKEHYYKNGKFVLVRHNYHTDFSVILKSGAKFLIEVKPSSQSPQTEKDIHKNPVMYKNACKWRAAIEYGKLNNYQFKLINEDHLKTRIF